MSASWQEKRYVKNSPSGMIFLVSQVHYKITETVAFEDRSNGRQIEFAGSSSFEAACAWVEKSKIHWDGEDYIRVELH